MSELFKTFLKKDSPPNAGSTELMLAVSREVNGISLFVI